MIKSLVGFAVGVAGALELSKWLEKRKARAREHGMAGTLLDKVNDRLEKRNTVRL